MFRVFMVVQQGPQGESSAWLTFAPARIVVKERLHATRIVLDAYVDDIFVAFSISLGDVVRVSLCLAKVIHQYSIRGHV